MSDETASDVKLYIGSEPMQRLPCEVLISSIMRRTQRFVWFMRSWDLKHGWHHLMEELPRLKGTGFSRWRWCIPEIQKEGRAIYLDADQVVLGDIGELFDILQPGKHAACVTNAEGNFGGQVMEKDACQTSVMVMDCTAGVWPPVRDLCKMVTTNTLPIQPGITPRSTYHALMQLQWLPREQVQSLPPEWNHFNIVTPESKLVHFSHVASQPWLHPEHPLTEFWGKELLASIEAGHVARTTVKDEIHRGHVHAYFGVLTKRG